MSVSPEQPPLLPVVRAALAFIQSPDEAAAVAAFEQQRGLLQPYEAQMQNR